MVKTNGKSQVDPRELDVEHELPAAEENEPDAPAAQAERPAAAGESEVQKLKSERDALLDRLARLQAEFENARRRSAKEQQDFKDFAAANTIKTLPPGRDRLERA